MTHDFKSLLNVPKRELVARRQELLDAHWADYGHKVSDNISAPGNLEKVINLAILRGRSADGIAKLVRIYLATGVISVRDD